MHSSRPLVIIILTLLWAGILITYDKMYNKYFYKPQQAQLSTLTSPQLSVWIQHVGCTGKTEEVVQVLQKIAWLSKLSVKRPGEMAGMSAEMGVKRPEEQQCDIGVVANVEDIAQVDFMEIDRALRARNIVPTTLEFGGIPHFGLRVQLANLCDTCAREAVDALSPRKDAKGTVTFKWLDSRRANPKDQTLTAFVRFHHEAHIEEMIRALDQAGFPPLSMRIVLE